MIISKRVFDQMIKNNDILYNYGILLLNTSIWIWIAYS